MAQGTRSLPQPHVPETKKPRLGDGVTQTQAAATWPTLPSQVHACPRDVASAVALTLHATEAMGTVAEGPASPAPRAAGQLGAASFPPCSSNSCLERAPETVSGAIKQPRQGWSWAVHASAQQQPQTRDVAGTWQSDGGPQGTFESPQAWGPVWGCVAPGHTRPPASPRRSPVQALPTCARRAPERPGDRPHRLRTHPVSRLGQCHAHLGRHPQLAGPPVHALTQRRQDGHWPQDPRLHLQAQCLQ